MIKTILYTAFIMLLSIGSKAQINLVGVANNLETGKIDIVKWQALDPESLTVYPTILDGYYFATSAFDSYNSNYYITGISGNNSGLYSYNTITNQENLVGGSLYTNISEFDMSTGKMYNLQMEEEEYISIYEYDINTNQDSLIGVIFEPGANALVADAIGFDANNGILYYVGFTNDPALCLYAIPVRENQFSFTRTILNPTAAPFNIITSVNFDNVNEIIYARNATYDSTFNYTGSSVVEINKTTGDIITRGELTGFPYFVAGSSSFDQNTGSFLLVGIDTSNMAKMIVFNTYDNTYVTGFVPGNVSEIVCDNTNFVLTYYITTGVKEEQEFSFKLYPNPVSEILTIDHFSSDEVAVQIVSAFGKIVLAQEFTSSKIELNLTSLPPGIYLVNLTSEGKTASEKIVVR
ncbi:MAG: T9SS type A sorting domain-containing protein [Bacteroidales bacterium]|nr:T9SS type A sorting domain-containing protein [Bacteroidales bacterium]